MFSGANLINLDAKGRFSMPARYREAFSCSQYGEDVVITVDLQQHCLLFYPKPTWLELASKLMQLSDTHPVERAVKRRLIGYAHEVSIDKQGRFLIPPALREFASLQKSMMFVGQLNKFEIWNDTAWQETIESGQEIINNADLTESIQLSSLSL